MHDYEDVVDPPGNYGPDDFPLFDQDEIDAFRREERGEPDPVPSYSPDFWPMCAKCLTDLFGEHWVIKQSQWGYDTDVHLGVRARDCYPDGTTKRHPEPIPDLTIAQALTKRRVDPTIEIPLLSEKQIRVLSWQFGLNHDRIFRMRLAKRAFRYNRPRGPVPRKWIIPWKPFPDMPPNPTYGQRLQKMLDVQMNRFAKLPKTRERRRQQ